MAVCLFWLLERANSQNPMVIDAEGVRQFVGVVENDGLHRSRFCFSVCIVHPEQEYADMSFSETIDQLPEIFIHRNDDTLFSARHV
jgi:hypothetical protein